MSTTSSKQTPKGALPAAQKGGELDNPTRLITEGPGEYIIVTLLAATRQSATASDQQR